jgi:hypothetical protein
MGDLRFNRRSPCLVRTKVVSEIVARWSDEIGRPIDHFVYIVIRGGALDGGVGAAGEIDSVSQAL